MKCTYLGFAPNQKAHLLVQQETGKILTSRDVVFDEGIGNRHWVILETYKDDSSAENKPKSNAHNSNAKNKPKPKTHNSNAETKPMENPPAAEPVTFQRSTQPSKPPQQYGANVGTEDAWLMHINAMVEAFYTALAAPPTTFAEAMSRVDAQMWMGAMNKEYNLITKHSVGRQVKQPIGRNVVECKWVFGYKVGPNGKILRYKVRLVAKGYSQRPGIDFEDTSSPVANSDSTRTLLAKGTSKDYNIIQLNIKTAFLHGTIKEEIYMEQPEGFEDDPVKYVWRLEKALYGLKQAAQAFYSQLRKVLKQIGFT
ncbi:Retrovirus-related Pol polyprotein from transposon TNT 1-94 [Rhizoctonia solani]|uniref:Retrovirus-related Pol polyprotein from transposon TNT 1-94 n=1 Tax=Rhizoctonia solani TaxID=456999 RepID=A0A8H8T0V7_9AGAM|nr:Retrovirus-related Pol polyprotein from transposon TNT 1-94 [Rhizoctonia solani]XP_043185376.1 Retrovirus-related Pol polyprotein from transposon TNT 1-94 [Rhizoctonia solani]QRW24120.1 Retrovirus-related Pol polyprotein from transposon TNT 1-94 [Rhizoctonia solani]QRW25139.1 Retrovirus-related Pol polyprotein from transposon TNT 1-94 [Rhizoctonia solani]